MNFNSRAWKIVNNCLQDAEESGDEIRLTENIELNNVSVSEEILLSDPLSVALQDEPIILEESSNVATFNTLHPVIINMNLLEPSTSRGQTLNDINENERSSSGKDSDNDSLEEYRPEESEHSSDTGSEDSPDMELVKIPQSTPLMEQNGAEAEIGATNQNPQNQRRRLKGRKKEDNPTRKRKRQSHLWHRNIRQQHCGRGESYVSARGKLVPGKFLKPPCQCRRKCFIPDGKRLQIFQHFYALSREAQNQYISDCVTEFEKKRQRIRTDTAQSRRMFSRKYQLNGTEVCQTMFLNTLGITLMKIRVILSKRRASGTSICPRDSRGRLNNHRTISEHDKQEVIHHINKFTTYESHYSRRHSAKKYLSSELSITKMYRLYAEEFRECGRLAVSEPTYRQIFVENFNLSFKKPKNNTCHKCDKFRVLIQTSVDPEQQRSIQDQYDKHLEVADGLYNEKSIDKAKSLQNSNTVFACFDLQQCLATPLLRSGLAFYKRSLWTFNLTTYSIVQKKHRADCFMWDETVAHRGGQEISACVLKFFRSLPDDVEEITLYSDCCGGQTRNIYFTIMCLLDMNDISQSQKKLRVINHKYLVPGHTHMEADSIHASIEKAQKYATSVKLEVPKDWMNFIRMIHRKTPLHVTEMSQMDFFDFSSVLSGVFVHRKINTNKEPIDWLNIQWMQYRRNASSTVYYKKSLNDEEFLTFDLMRHRGLRRSSKIPQIMDIKSLNKGSLPLPSKKLNDLKSILEYIHPSSRLYYQNLTPDDEVPDVAPFASSDEEDA